ncbi:tetratricopeptide repeat protein [Peristeroidobacter agariperforans]|uniref:tetratricopeptide repeat protein n=1 Tax=Peristeroidobacter agariperforans TaxID=268404 RepID=UPI00101C5148|nr:tetratricopeptide repeat protein [Peristeroidobacter agariperforans]
MMTRTATLVLLLFAAAAGAQSIDYDPRRAVELRPCDEHRYHGRSEQARACYAKLLESPTPIVQAEAAWAVGDIQRANRIFRDTVQNNERAVQPRVRWARLYLQTHQYSDAVELFGEALKVFPNDVHAKLGLASVYAERFEGQARPLVEDALKQDGDLIEAHLLTASMDLEEGQLDDADKALDRAMRVVSKEKLPPLEVYTLRASLEMARGNSPDQWIKRILDYNPRYGAMYQQLAHFEIMRRRYKEATVLLRRAVEVQPDLWGAHAELGSNLLRLGNVNEARTHLQAAYSGDPYSPTTVNSLRLLDRIDEFSISEDPVVIGEDTYQVQLRLHKKESDVLRPYVLDLTGRSIQSLSQRYGFKPREPITVELYPDHDDFAVRVAALPGIGLLGVTFGYVVAMDSPSSRPTSEFHWGSTLWHEMAHVFTLEVTDHHVPRWLSEGISVFEEWRTGPTPGVAVTPEAIAALEKKQFLPVADLDSGFIRPSYPGQVQVSYMQSGLVCLFIEQRWGFEQLGALLRQFDGKRTTAQAIEATFKIAPAAFDKEFDTFVRTRFANVLANFEDWQQQMLAARQALQKERWADAVEPARRAVALYPEHVGGDSAHLMLAKALDKLNRRSEAIVAMEAYRRAGGWDPTALRELARWLDEAGRTQDATNLMVSLNYSDPLNAEVHAQLGERLLTAGRNEDALREFQALLALNKLDQAPAHYGMARALREMGDKLGSRRHLLDALATAPHFKPAQALLLKMIEERS